MLTNKDLKKKALDKDLDKISFVSEAAEAMGRRLVGPGLALVFLVICACVAAFHAARAATLAGSACDACATFRLVTSVPSLAAYTSQVPGAAAFFT